MLPQTRITADTPMGATLVAGGATFRVWAPSATQVYLNGVFSGVSRQGQVPDLAMRADGHGYWTGFFAAVEGDLYRFYVIGTGSDGYKRDPYAREMALDAAFPNCSCVIRSPVAYAWHDAAFVTPDYSNMIVYQLHIGSYAPSKAGVTGTFLDVIEKIDYLVALGINVLQPLPVDELESDPSMGYNGADYFAPDMPYVVYDAATLANHLSTINRLLTTKGFAPINMDAISSATAQLKAMVDLCHVYGIAVMLDVVYNHAGGFDGDNASLYYWDRAPNTGDNNQSLYFTDQDRGTGGLSFALWNNDVRQFLINHASYCVDELHVDGFRYDEISSLLSMNKNSGWDFCRALTDTLRYMRPRLLQNAEYWPFEFGDYPRTRAQLVAATGADGAGFDVMQHDGLRSAVRNAIRQAAMGEGATVELDAIARNLYPEGLPHAWQAITCIENHDIVKIGQELRIAALADGVNARSWYARSRARLANGILLTAPGIPQLFMGQEFLADQQWNWDPTASASLIAWNELSAAADSTLRDHLRFTQDLIRLRWRQPALRGDNVNVFHVHNRNRVMALHRWLEGNGRDVVVVINFAESTWYDYAIGLPFAGAWLEVFNSDVYDHWVNPLVVGNAGGVVAIAQPLHGFNASATLVLPANGLVVFARDRGD